MIVVVVVKEEIDTVLLEEGGILNEVEMVVVLVVVLMGSWRWYALLRWLLWKGKKGRAKIKRGRVLVGGFE